MIRIDRHVALYGATLAVALLTLTGCVGPGAPTKADGTVVRDGGARSPVIATPTRTVRETIVTAVANRPADFTFAFTSAACDESTTIDTFADTFTVFVPQDGRYNGGTRTTPFLLTSDEVRAIYQQMLIMDFFDYPPSLTTSSPRQGGRASGYSFRVRRAGREQTFHWTTVGTPTPTAMERDLAALTSLLTGIVYAHRETQSVPRGVGCT